MRVSGFDADELVDWAELYGHPEEWAKRAQAAHARAERAAEQRDELVREIDHLRLALPYMLTVDSYRHAISRLIQRRRELVPNVTGPACPDSTRPTTSRR